MPTTFTTGPKEGTIQTDGLKKALKWIILGVVLMTTLMIISVMMRFKSPEKSSGRPSVTETQVTCPIPQVRHKTNMVEVLITSDWHDFDVAGKRFEADVIKMAVEVECRWRRKAGDEWNIRTLGIRPDGVGTDAKLGPVVDTIGYRIKPGSRGNAKVFMKTVEIM